MRKREAEVHSTARAALDANCPSHTCACTRERVHIYIGMLFARSRYCTRLIGDGGTRANSGGLFTETILAAARQATK